MCTASAKSSSVVNMECKHSIQLLLLIFTSCSAQSTYYVMPTADAPCLGEPCHTLSEYVANQYFMNLPVNITMEFLPGNHTLDQIISVINLTWLTLHGDSSSLPEVTSRIVCTQPAGFVFTDITELYISSLAFISCGHNGSAAVNITSVQQCNISSCGFYSNINVGHFECQLVGYQVFDGGFSLTECRLGHVYAKGGALYIQDSNILLTENLFQNNFATEAAHGGVLYGVDSNLTVTDNTFQNNSAGYGGVHVLGSYPYLGECFSLCDPPDHVYAKGGALYIQDSNILLTENLLQNNFATGDGGVLYVLDSNLNVTDNTFQNNSATDKGGVLYVWVSNLAVTVNTFQNNSAKGGGVLYVLHSNLTVTENTFQNNSVFGRVLGSYYHYFDGACVAPICDNDHIYAKGGALYIQDSYIILTGNLFQNNSAIGAAGEDYGGGYEGVLYVENTNLITVTDNTFQNNSATDGGGVLYVWVSNFAVTDNTYQNNFAESGGVLYIRHSSLTVTNSTFQNNSATSNGGVVLAVWDSSLTVTDNTFQNNSAEAGGVLSGEDSNLTVTDNTFQNNSAEAGGVLHVFSTSITFMNNSYSTKVCLGGLNSVCISTLTISNNTFQNNSATSNGGVLYGWNSTLTVTNNTFQNNSATSNGGVLYVMFGSLTVMNNTLQNNSADFGGILSVSGSNLITVTDNTFQNNSATSNGGVLAVRDSSLTVTDNTFQNNSAEAGGVLYVADSNLTVTDSIFQNNSARYGGGLYVYNTDITGNVILTNNLATEEGGGMYISRSTVTFTGNTTIMNNSAIDGNGGGLLLSGESQLYLQPNANVSFISNSAKSSGGAIMIAERNPLAYCTASRLQSDSDCFFQIKKLEKHKIGYYPNSFQLQSIINGLKIGMYFDNNSAEAGADLYGGSVDNCIVKNLDTTSCPNIIILDISVASTSHCSQLQWFV